MRRWSERAIAARERTGQESVIILNGDFERRHPPEPSSSPRRSGMGLACAQPILPHTAPSLSSACGARGDRHAVPRGDERRAADPPNRRRRPGGCRTSLQSRRRPHRLRRQQPPQSAPPCSCRPNRRAQCLQECFAPAPRSAMRASRRQWQHQNARLHTQDPFLLLEGREVATNQGVGVAIRRRNAAMRRGGGDYETSEAKRSHFAEVIRPRAVDDVPMIASLLAVEPVISGRLVCAALGHFLLRYGFLRTDRSPRRF